MSRCVVTERVKHKKYEKYKMREKEKARRASRRGGIIRIGESLEKSGICENTYTIIRCTRMHKLYFPIFAAENFLKLLEFIVRS